MTNEQRVRIDRLERYLIADKDKIYTRVRVDDLDTVLSLIKEQQENLFKIAKNLGIEENATIDEIYTAIQILKSKRINVIEQLDCIEAKNKKIDKLESYNKDLLRKLKNRVKQVKKLEKYSLYKSELSKLNERIRSKDKQIDLMAEYWNSGLAMCENCDKIVENFDENKCKDCIKQYFERKVEGQQLN